MKSTWVLALSLSLLPLGELRAQPLPYPYPPPPGVGFLYGGGYVSGGGIGIIYSRRHLSIGAFLGGYSSSRYSAGAVYFGDPYGPAYASPSAPVIVGNQVNVQFGAGKPFQRMPTLQEETAGIDLDAQSPGKKLVPEEPPEPPANLPGQDVSKPRPPVRPEDPPPPKPKIPKEAPPPKEPPPPEEPPPQANPRDENARLVNLGLAAFAAQEYVLAAHRFRQATLVEPKSAPAHFFLAQAQFALGKYRPAVDAIHAGMSLTKDWPKAPFRPRVDLYKVAADDFVDHLGRLRATLAKSPDDPAYLFLTAYQLWFDDRRDEAVPLFRQARPLTADRRFIDQFLAAAAPGVVAAAK
jgi:hypothetical protein